MLRVECRKLSPSLLLGGGRRRGYHTRNCFGHRVKPTITNTVSEDWARRRAANPNLWRLVCAYRDHGHRVANLDPLKLTHSPTLFELDPSLYGLANEQKDLLYPTECLIYGYSHQQATLSDIIHYLKDTYCGTLTLESAHITNTEEREWLSQCYEQSRHLPLSQEKQRTLLTHLLHSQTLDFFLAKKFSTLKRYGAEGAEGMMGFLQEAFSSAVRGGVSDVIVGMPHRGRLNILTGLLKVSPTALFHKIKGNAEFFEGAPCVGDVLSHMTSSVSLEMSDGEDRGPLHVSLLPNPSHLEAINPVIVGKARARQLSLREGQYHYGEGEGEGERDGNKVLSIQIHGDAAFSAQGVVMETLGMTSLPYFGVGGALHLVVNNQLGFTAPRDHGRSSQYCTDIMKMIDAPVLHVNGDHPEDVVRATSIAMDYWQKFQNDVMIDMVCFRRWGHNEVDNPSLTQPTMYHIIDNRSTVPDIYSDKLQSLGVVNRDNVIQITSSYTDQLNQCLKEADNYTPSNESLRDRWNGIEFAPSTISSWDTGVPVDVLKYVGAKSVSFPEDKCKVNARLQKGNINERIKSLENGVGINWATAEALAFGSLLYQGFNIRLSGQDVGRGTFSHRHSMLVCQESDAAYIPLNYITSNQTAFLEIANSHLSEEAVLGFEYGFSIESANNLVIWEAQYGDFYNGAQIMVDTFISSGEAKWLLQSGLVMLLPHGVDGTGPEHSSCRIERFLQMTDSSERGPDGDCVNMHVVHPTTPAQYFHLLRKQMVQNFRKPLIVASPKIILRATEATSNLEELGPGTTFHPVLGDETADPNSVSHVILCSGKHYYLLAKQRREMRAHNTAIIRLEQLCPFPSGDIHRHIARFPNVTEYIWSQEEPENMGAWPFVEPRFRRQLGIQLSYAGRRSYPCPATGVANIHQAEIKQLLTDTFSHVLSPTPLP